MALHRHIFKQDAFRETGFGNKVVDSNLRLMKKIHYMHGPKKNTKVKRLNLWF